MTEVITNALTATEGLSDLCRLCGRSQKPEVSIESLPVDLQNLIRANLTSADATAQICRSCLTLFSRALQNLKTNEHAFADAHQALPTPLRMDADERFTGKGVTIAFLDSGFYAHTDLTEPVNRIVAYHSIFAAEDDPTFLSTPDVASWHGMMTSVVAAGNGFLSDGLYRGIAPEANVVLVKIGKTGRIPEANIEAGLVWVLENKDKFGIRIVNISAGGDFEQS